ncbi:LacI family DNA-binding transcriptional regulator [Nocardioides sp. NPDC006273]|uniref:LacI family DNA-binding transcriptional regulator n=1 Tax=Nocardioides sp. NPDC006273 TaxID=3155598 RepID=UPI0033BC1D11
MAEAAGVSRTTVSFVLNDHPNAGAIPEATRRRVLATAEKLGYTPSPEARALRSGRSSVVLCLMPDWPITGPFGVLLREVSSELNAVGLTMLFHQRSPGEDLTQVFGALTPRAVVAIGELSQAEVDIADRRGIAVTSFMGDVPNREDVSALKQTEIGKLQADALIKHGHTSLAYVSPADRALDWFSTPRLEGARNQLSQAGGRLIHWRLPSGNNGSAVRKWLTQATANGLTGICAYNDEVAFALMMAASAEGLSVPADVSVVGADDSPLSRLTRPALTTIAFRLTKEAQRLAAIVTDSVKEQAKPRPSTLLMLKVRESVRNIS